MDMLAALRLQIEWGADEALEDAPLDRRQVAQAAGAFPRPAAPRATAPPAATAPTGRAPPPQLQAAAIAAAAGSVAELRAALEQFDGCDLRATATNLVFADGNPASGLMVIGEGAGCGGGSRGTAIRRAGRSVA